MLVFSAIYSYDILYGTLFKVFDACTFRTCLNTFRREHDRFWVLAAHPTLNIFAAGLYSIL